MNHYQLSIALLCAIFMIAIPTTTIFLNYAGIFFLTNAHGQDNSTAILKDIQTMLNKQTSSQQKIATFPNKSANQGVYITLSVFFLGISLVVFGLRMTMKGAQNFAKYFNLMILALTYENLCWWPCTRLGS